MLTNVIAYLHTTLAYQSAAMQLMVGQANFDAQQLHLREALPIVVPADTNQWIVAMPPDGVTGRLTTSNYIYRFNAGKLTWIQIRNLPHSAAEMQSSLIDTNEAYQLAQQWLTALSVDVLALESKCPHTVQFAAPPTPRNHRESSRYDFVDHARGTNGTAVHPNAANNPATAHRAAAANEVLSAATHVRLPVYRVNWGGQRAAKSTSNAPPLQISMEILGSTKQCLGLHIFNPDLLKAPPLQVTNAAALLGPPPSPQQFVEEFLGGKTVYDTVAHPERVLVWLVGGTPDDPATKTNRTQALVLDPATAGVFSRVFTDFNSYSWIEEKVCTPDYGVRLRFTKGADIVDLAWCYDCDHVQVTHNGQSADKDCDAAHLTLVRTVQSLFPKDEIIKSINSLSPSK